MKILTLHAILATFLSLVAASPIEWVPGKYRGLITGRAHRTDVRRILGRPEWIGQPEGAEDGPVAGRLQYSYKVRDGRWEWLRVVMRARTGCVDEIVLETRDDVPITLTEALQ